MVFGFIKGVLRRGGAYVFLSSLGVKVVSFLLMVVVVRLLSEEDYGAIAYARSIMFFFVVFAGAGMDRVLLRYGSFAENESKKARWYIYTLARGFAFSCFLTGVLLLSSELLCIKIPEARAFLMILAFQLSGEFLLNNYLNYLRVIKNNKRYSGINIIRSITTFLVVVVFILEDGAKGFALATVFAPLIIILMFLKDQFSIVKKRGESRIEESSSELMKYGVWVGFSGVMSGLLFQVDGIILGNMINDIKQLAYYKVASIIPINLRLIPSTFLVTDFVFIAEKRNDAAFLKKYLLKYMLLFGLICIGMVSVVWAFSDWIVVLLFGENYRGSGAFLNVLIMGISGAFILRQPFGNVLNALGQAKFNAMNSMFAVFVSVLLNIILIKKYGAIGAAYGTSIALWVSGLFAMSYFYYYIGRQKQ